MTQALAVEGTQQWAYRYLAAGLSLLPTAPHDKNPYHDLLPSDESGRRIWGCWSRVPPDPETVAYWFSKRPDAGLGVVCGAVSSGLQVLDVDDGLFARWLEARLEHLPGLRETWSVRTGSGKLHVYARSTTPLGPGEHKLIDSRDGRRLADIRDEGAYVVAPPSFGPSGGQYVTLRGEPESIMQVGEAVRVWHALATAYAKNGHHPPRTATVNAVADAVSQRFSKAVRKPARGEELERVEKMVSDIQSIRARRAIVETDPSWPGWDGSDWSDLDWRVIKEVLQAGGRYWSDDDFEAIWATFPIGEHCYRNVSRPQHGAAYLLGYTLPRARAEYEQKRKEAEAAAGHNFNVLSAKQYNYEPENLYELVLERTDVEPHQTHRVTITPAELGNERSFILAVFNQTRWVLQLQGPHKSADGYRQFLAVLGGVMEVVEPPEGATEKGQLWSTVRRAILDRLARREGRPEKLSDIRFGWRERDVLFVSSSALMAHLRQEQKKAPRPQEVWQVMEAKGARALYMKVGGSKEEVWTINSSALA